MQFGLRRSTLITLLGGAANGEPARRQRHPGIAKMKCACQHRPRWRWHDFHR
jgi:hypothetical protein